MSMAAAYSSLVGAPNEGARMSKRIVNTGADYNLIFVLIEWAWRLNASILTPSFCAVSFRSKS